MKILPAALTARCVVYISLLSITIAIAVLSPIAWSGLYSDDTINGSLAGAVGLSGQTLPLFTWENSWAWIHRQGRIFPVGLGVIFASFYYLGPDPLPLKLLHLGLTLLAVALAALLVARLSGSKRVGLLVLLLTPLLFQARAMHDPLTTFIPLAPTLLILLFGQALALDAYWRNGRRGALVVAMLLFTAALLTYELALAWVPVLGVIALRHWHGVRNAALRLAPFMVILAAYLLAASVVRTGRVYEGIAVGTFDAWPRSFAINLIAGLPFSYRVLDPQGLFAANPERFDPTGPFMVAAAGLGGLFVLAWILLARAAERPAPLASVILIGVCLWLMPAAIFAASARYQGELNYFGAAHLQSVVETFGVAILIACAATKLIENTRAGAVAFCVVGCFLPGLSLWHTRAVVRHEDARFASVEREQFIRALRGGVLNPVPDGATIVAEVAWPWLRSDLVWLLTGKKVTIVPAPAPGSDAAFQLSARRDGVTLTTIMRAPQAP